MSVESSIFIQALQGKNTRRPPVWLMRQAGRYMWEYQALRKKHSFLTLCEEIDLIVQVTRLPIEAFHFDAAIIFSDILLLLKALGIPLHFEENSGPKVGAFELNEKTLDYLEFQDVTEKLQFVYKAIKELKSNLQVPLIGFSGAAWTLASYLIEGKSAPLCEKTKKIAFEKQELFQRLLIILSKHIHAHISAQVQAGVDAIQIFDSWSNAIPYAQLDDFLMIPLERSIQKLSCPTLLFSKLSTDALVYIHQRIPHIGLSVSHQESLVNLRKKYGITSVLQGNLDPAILLIEDEQYVATIVKNVCESMQKDQRFIFNLAHGIKPETPRKNVEKLVETILRI